MTLVHLATALTRLVRDVEVNLPTEQPKGNSSQE